MGSLERIYIIDTIPIEKVWGKSINGKRIGEIIKLGVSKNISSKLISSKREVFDLYKIYNSVDKNIFFGNNLKESIFPYTIKKINSVKRLSLQVHPKPNIESWYFCNKEKARILVGFNQNLSHENIDFNLIPQKCNEIEVEKGNFITINSGIIHSVLEGNEIIEVKDNSDIIYRCFDWDNNRKLDVEEFIKNAYLETTETSNLVIKDFKQFISRNYSINKICINKNDEFESGNSNVVLTILDGQGIIESNNKCINIRKDITLFILPNTYFKIYGNVELLLIEYSKELEDINEKSKQMIKKRL